MATYSREQIQELETNQAAIHQELDRLLYSLLTKLEPSLTNARAKEYLLHGVCRRLNILKRCAENIFAIFPVDRTSLMKQDERIDMEINLHSFMININGVLDNLAWVYVLEKSVEDTIKRRRTSVGMFIDQTQRLLPASIRAYLQSDVMTEWYSDYAKNYRDALAHRIPPYVPPSVFNKEDEKKFRDLEHKIQEAIARHDIDGIEKLMAQQDKIGSISPLFAHSFSDHDTSAPIYLHPQIIVDVRTVVAIATLFCKHFHDEGKEKVAGTVPADA